MPKKTTNPLKILEKDVLKTIMSGLSALGIYHWRNNTGSVVSDYGGGKVRFIRYGKKGSSDIFGILKGGRFFAIEVKRPGGKLSPEQKEFINEVNSLGGLAFKAESWEDVENNLKK